MNGIPEFVLFLLMSLSGGPDNAGSPSFIWIDPNASPDIKVTKMYVAGHQGSPEIWRKIHGQWIQVNQGGQGHGKPSFLGIYQGNVSDVKIIRKYDPNHTGAPVIAIKLKDGTVVYVNQQAHN